MGVFSKVHRFREAGEDANVRNVERFGEPRRSLFTSSKVMTLHHRIEITDANENVVYRAETKFPSLHDKTEVYDAAGRHLAHIEKKFFTLHERHFITMEDGTAFQLSNELFHLIKDVSNLEGLGWQLRGNIAVIAQKLFSLHDKYCIDIYRPEYEKEVVAILITLQHMIRDRQAAASSSSSSSSSSN